MDIAFTAILLILNLLAGFVNLADRNQSGFMVFVGAINMFVAGLMFDVLVNSFIN